MPIRRACVRDRLTRLINGRWIMSRFARLPLALSVTAVAALGLSAPSALAAAAQSAHRAAAPAGVQQATLVGELGVEGGAYPGGFHPTAGTVQVAFSDQPLVLLKHVGKSGHFRIELASGSYEVTGCGPSSSGSRFGECSKPRGITLKSGEVKHIRLIWAEVP